MSRLWADYTPATISPPNVTTPGAGPFPPLMGRCCISNNLPFSDRSASPQLLERYVVFDKGRVVYAITSAPSLFNGNRSTPGQAPLETSQMFVLAVSWVVCIGVLHNAVRPQNNHNNIQHQIVSFITVMMWAVSSIFLLPLAASALPSFHYSSNHVPAYDYIVVGGGTSGLVIANRLSENPDVTVLVIEAGGSVYNNPNVTNVNGYGLAFGTDIDWAYESVNQTYAGGAKQTLRAAKALGGTSTINGLSYARAQVAQIDAWEKLGNDGWNWDSLFPYYKKSESFQIPDAARAEAGHMTWVVEDHGLNGPLKTGWAYTQANTSVPVTLNTTLQNLGLEWNPDINSGYMNGFSVMPTTADQTANVREDAARAYYYPYQGRKNIHVKLDSLVSKLTWKSGCETPTAEGVVFSSNGETFTVRAKREVVLSAGALVSPLLLELSGVGNPAILKQYGIETVVDLPTVGENLQDQLNNGEAWTVAGNLSVTGGQTYVAYPSFSQLYGNGSSTVASQLKSSLPAYAAQVAAANGNATRASDILDFFNIQYDLILNDELPLAELLFFNSAGSWASQYWGLLPFSRGNVHIGSPNTTAGGLIDPKYFMLDIDTSIQTQASRLARQTLHTAPLASFVGSELRPGANVTTDAEFAEFLKASYRSNYHSVGTTAMMAKSKGGVVDPAAKVYDAGVLPFQVCGHLTSTLYAMAEKVADAIKADQHESRIKHAPWTL
ncbi:GMC oxidoreductase [Polychaeton citri CBS 116435]|uniref:GMC oxidoreductase n=1 Tax=Polychaeton citri CBS 116435 TaxID=1314669 RepID=A0A9P4UU14_9PEZI|nr:GMC oxidoreductase [Polychaeton citri CBS 116435]